MGRFLAIDYGEKRVGLAVSDYMQVIATKLNAVSTLDIFSFLKDYMSREEVDLIVVGNPKQLDNTPSQSAQSVKIFVDNLCATFPDIDIYMIDERYTSKIASQTIAKSGLKKKKKQDKGLIDAVAAVLILQDFMKMYKDGHTDEPYNN
ncbi:MAG: Holliday junction resolvase RuvX [Bacteroidales bacterium]|nr:Holliday junction resolvase RuvX [Bacteroidales bacterium]MBQ7984635.1 Holliday junction resolvase RuvX [Bacteroidales bacterium]